MMATGNSRPVIFSVIFIEAVLLGLGGAAFGLAFGSLAAKLISSFGIVLPPIPGSATNYVALILLEPVSMIKVFSLGVLSTLFASVLPAYRACHFEIIHALGYV